MMKDPEKKKMFEDYSASMQQAVEKLQNDPEMKDFFEDIKKNGIEAIKKYENDDNLLRKFSMATGGPGGPTGFPVPGMAGMGGAPAAVAPSFKPGDEVYITGLSKKPELNGQKAMVVP